MAGYLRAIVACIMECKGGGHQVAARNPETQDCKHRFIFEAIPLVALEAGNVVQVRIAGGKVSVLFAQDF